MADLPIAVMARSPARGDRLRDALERTGHEARGVPPEVDPHDLAAAAGVAVLDVDGLSDDDAVELAERLSGHLPVLAVGSPARADALAEAVRAGAADLAIDPGDGELAARVALLLRARRQALALRRREGALVELAAASGETLDPVAVLRAILGWLGRVLPAVEPAVVIAAPAPGGPVRTVLPGRGAAAPLSRAELEARPELRRALAGERIARTELAREGGRAEALAFALAEGEDVLGALALRAARPLPEDDLRLALAAAALAGRALASARAADAAARERERVERAYADRFRELLEANRRLRELSHARSELLAGAAGELRRHLEAFRAHRTDGDAEAGREVGRMEAILDDLLDPHAIATGSLELHARPLDVAALARDTLAPLDAVARDRGVRLVARIPAGPLVVAADPTKLGEALTSLVGNALTKTPPGGEVQVEVEPTAEGGARLAVRDEGPGIPGPEPSRLAGGGTLLDGIAPGLAIAREIVALHGGHLEAESVPGAGSTFRAVLPPAPRLPAARPGLVGPDRRRPSVLLVEDDEDTLDLLAGLLEDGYDVLTARDGEEGVRAARDGAPDVILLDLYLPRLDGFGALEELRRDGATAEIPVIFLSAQRDDLVRARGLHLGAADFVVKPFSATELRARIDRVLQATRKQAHLRALAQQDALTGLPNFGAFRNRLEEEVKRTRRYRTELAAVMLDLDNLKPVNDQLGHAAGNRAIVAVADAIRAELRETDFAARYGGDEFVVLLPHTDAAHARILADRLRRAVRRIEVDGGAVPLRASFGVASLGPDADGSGEALVRAADGALYRAKRTGRDRVCVAGEDEARAEGAMHGV